MLNATSASKDKAEKKTLGVMLHKIWNEVARAEQKWRSEISFWHGVIRRFVLLLEVCFGGYVYKTMMDHPSMNELDRKFIVWVYCLAKPKTAKKEPEPVAKKLLDPAEIQKRATASHV